MFFAMSQTSWHGQGREDHKEYDCLSAGVHHKGLQRLNQRPHRTLPNQTPPAQQTCKFRSVAELEKTGTVKAALQDKGMEILQKGRQPNTGQ